MLNHIIDALKTIIAKLRAYWDGLSPEAKKALQEKVWSFVKEHFVKKWEAYQATRANSDPEGAQA